MREEWGGEGESMRRGARGRETRDNVVGEDLHRFELLVRITGQRIQSTN
jgi:hypothetical protein